LTEWSLATMSSSESGMLVKAASATTASSLPMTSCPGAFRVLSGCTTGPGSSQSPEWMCDGRGGEASCAAPGSLPSSAAPASAPPSSASSAAPRIAFAPAPVRAVPMALPPSCS
jgi:hypothetical protein